MQVDTCSTSAQTWFSQALELLPGGVNSPVRSLQAVGGTPCFIKKAQGAYLTDTTEKRYVDYVGSFGPMLLGHAHPVVISAVQQAISHGLSFGAPCVDEVQLAQLICNLMPSIEKIRMLNSGTEAVMAAIRLARAATGRQKIIKFEGCYHGWSDSVMVKAGSGTLTHGVAGSAGIDPATVHHTLIAKYNDLDSVEQLLSQYPSDIAALLIEPIAGNMNLIKPTPGFLQGVRDLCDRYGVVLIFDEVMTGFRVHLGGAQALYNIKPDLTLLGKVIGGGMPIGAVGGSRELMDLFSPIGPVYQAGTFSGNPVSMAAGYATLKLLNQQTYSVLNDYSEQLVTGLITRAQAAGIGLTGCFEGGLFGFFFTEKETVSNYAAVAQCDTTRFIHFFRSMLAQGIYLAPSPFEAGFVSTAHQAAEMEQTLNAAEFAFNSLND